MPDHDRPSFPRRAARRTLTIVGTLGVVGLAGAAVFFGSETLAARAAATAPPDTAERTLVQVTPLRVENGYTVPRQFVGQIEAGASSDLSFELGGRLTEVLIEEGDSVTAGDVLARLDTVLLETERDRLVATRDATTAQLRFAETRVERANALRGQGFASQEALDQAIATRDELKSRIAETSAAMTTVDINIAKSVLYAPFDGRIGAQMVDGGETLGAGQHVVTLIETVAPQVRVGLPLNFTETMLSGLEVEIAGTRYPAEFIQFRPDIDPVTRTRTALFEIDAEVAPAFGQTATLFVETQVELAGTWVPFDALQEGSGSAWTVLVVDDGIVRTASVELLHAEATRAFVRGTFEEGAQLIDAGAHRVVPGQEVQTLKTEG